MWSGMRIWLATYETASPSRSRSRFVAVTLSAMGAYAMSRLRSRMIDAALITVLLLQVFPEALLATPIFIIFKTLGLLNSYLAVILATSARAVAFGLIILRPMFGQVPFELEEASYVDGCSDWQTFSRIVLPLMRVPLTGPGGHHVCSGVWAVRLPADLAQSAGTAARHRWHIQLHRHGDRRLAPRHGVRRAVRATDSAAVRGFAASDRVRAYRRRVEVVYALPVANCNRE